MMNTFYISRRKSSSILAKMKIFLPLVVWIVLLFRTASTQYSASRKNVGIFGLKHEVFFLNLEDGYFGCQVNESTDYLQLYELSKLCDGTSDCYMGSDELRNKLKCTNDCDKDGTACSNGACLEGQCHCNDGFGGCNCQVPDENECKYRPCDVFAHCTNTLGSFTCTCFPGYRGDGFHCEDIDECQDPSIAARCVENAECCNLPAHFVCKCKPGFDGDGEERCTDINECLDPQACGVNAECVNFPGNYTCLCKDGFIGDPYNGCGDIDECAQPDICGPGAICTNFEGSFRCDCPGGFEGDARSAQGCTDFDECTRSPCGRNALCRNDVGSFRCECADGFHGDPMTDCQAACTATEECKKNEICTNGQCINPCHEQNSCGMNAECLMIDHFKQCSCPTGFTGDSALECVRIPTLCTSNADCGDGTACHDSMCLPRCGSDQDCALNEKCVGNKCMLTCRLDNDCFLGHICLNGRCVYGCHSDDDCSASETCRANHCTDPCQENPCGPNAACTVVNHRASCSCINGMVPSPTAKIGCIRAPALQCRINKDCSDGTQCIENLCRSICANDQGCLNNERCDRGTCKPICRRDDDCRTGELCQGQTCLAGCRSDTGCSAQLTCIAQQCVDPCLEPTACGTNARCTVVNHQKQCSCPTPLNGDPLVGCRAEQRSCQARTDCPKGHACYGNTCMSTCRNDQNCLTDERCIRGTCRTVCNSDASCGNGLICENRVCQAGCRTDNNCLNNQACINKQCTDPCTVLGQCGTCSECTVINHGVQCSCPNGYLGNPLVSCSPPPQKCNSYCYCDEEGVFCADKCRQVKDCSCGQTCYRGRCRTKCNPGACSPGQLCQNGACIAGCRSNADCAGERSCVNKKCVDPCTVDKACGKNALCQAADHQAFCLCPDGFQGDPRDRCVQYECQTNEDCELDKKCADGKCINPCLEPNACGLNAQCRVVNRQAQCSCTPGFFGNARQECQPVEKHSCSQNPCGENTICREDNNGYECTCQPGCMGDPQKGCLCQAKQTSKCHQFPCGKNAICRLTSQDQPECYCPPLYSGGDPYTECTNERTVSDCRTTGCTEGECVRDGAQFICRNEIGCKHNEECPAERSCINGLCIDPCHTGNLCEAGQECEVQNHEPVCIKLCQCQRTSDCESGLRCDGCNCIQKDTEDRGPICRHCPPGIPCNPITGACIKVECTSSDECPLLEACIANVCQRPCDVENRCVLNAVCINKNHGSECSCVDGYHGNGYVSCQLVTTPGSVCQYNEDCPPDKLCDRLNRVCINPCQEDSCGDNAECLPRNHGIECQCRNGFSGNAYIQCIQLQGCKADSECDLSEACINGQCTSPCQCGPYALCDVKNHKGNCRCPLGYRGDGHIGCSPPSNPCDPNPCGLNAMCEVDAGSPICFCPKGLTGNPFKNCIPEGDECNPNPCGPNSGCRKINNQAACFCLPEFEGNPPEVSCKLPQNPCDPSPCGPNTQCAVLNNGYAKCTCLSGYIESPNTVRGCVEPRNPCDPNPCGFGAICDSSRNPECYCPEGFIGNPFRSCAEPTITPELCKPGPCGKNADCYTVDAREQCFCRPGFIGDAYTGCSEHPRSACEPNPCGPGADCLVLPDGSPECRCPPGVSGEASTSEGCRGFECRIDSECAVNKACIGFQCVDPCPGACAAGAYCKVEKHHPVCFCNAGLTGNPAIRCYATDERVPDNQCNPSPCGINTQCTVRNKRPVCKCLPNYKGDPKKGCRAECELNSDCPSDRACVNRRCVPPCNGAVCGVNAECHVEYHTPICKCPNGFTGDSFVHCVPIPEERNMTRQPCQSSPCGPQGICSVYGDDVALCDPCSAPDAIHNPRCRPKCVLNTDCPFNLACLQGKCLDPCPGSCGYNAHCTVEQHRPVCSCPLGLYGNPYERCIQQDTPLETCDSIRCGANTECKRTSGALACICRKNYYGDPLVGCRPECVINTDCSVNKACVNTRCQDPCVGVCGVNAFCKVVNHLPVCYCAPTHTGDALIACTEKSYLPPDNTPCDPNPCGPNSKCLATPENYAVCSCLPGFRGMPPACQAECMINAECPQNQACINLKCIDPCPGTCGVGATCEVLNHNPICSCGPNQQGDPFVICESKQNKPPSVSGNPCDPSPCGLNSICQVKRNRPVCSCQANFIGTPPYCRPECVISSECTQDKACINEKCKNPCENACGLNADCHVVAHSAFCNCRPGFEGDAFIGCSEIPRDIPQKDVCYPSPCADNAVCTEVNGAPKCSCIAPYLGDPYNTGCRPECVLHSDCPSHLACVNQHCRDPCPGKCGSNAECTVANHIPVCECVRGYVGDAFRGCRKDIPQPITPKDPCAQCPSSSVCRIVQGRPTCSCPEGYRGAPPACRPECSSNEECRHDQACINLKCKDPCPGLCGINAQCQVINHKAFCSCLRDYYGNPFEQCMPKPLVPIHPCQPSPCGPYSECRELNDRAVCSCVPGMLGTAPNCRPECESHQDCPSNRACFGQRCKDPCVGSCGFNAQCVARDHRPECYCIEGFEGDPYNGCNPVAHPPVQDNPCNPSPCGANALCKERSGAGSCVCLPDYFGDPYTGCRPECVQNSECDKFRACVNNKCKDPCPGVCGLNAECRVQNHSPICLCLEGYTGDPSRGCNIAEIVTEQPKTEGCYPSPCGPNSHCREVNGHPVCSCQSGYIGTPPSCRPECVVSSECSQDRACISQKCADPCPGTCGTQARCQVVNHNPICSCPPGFTGDPFIQCSKIERDTIKPVNPCSPSPCGPNSQCRVVGMQAACTCQVNYIGRPPNCRPECTIDAECASNLACQNERCIDPCPGSCGHNAACQAINHRAVCVCNDGYEGNPLLQCDRSLPPVTERLTPCTPSPCGPNAECRERNQAGACYCLQGYEGNPYDVFSGCRRECDVNSDCAENLACVNYKCVDPCPGVCGNQALCEIVNHVPTCACPEGMIGDPFSRCELRLEDSTPTPPVCDQSTCGPNSICRIQNDIAVCKCQAEMIGSPPNCHPECLQNADCDSQGACVNYKCIDPCPGSCGQNAKCQVINHNPICSCNPGFTGDPFTRCYKEIREATVAPPTPCVPSPCGPNAECKAIGGKEACSCLPDYVGTPPNCRPECVLSTECSQHLACIRQKCTDPCPGSCGLNAKCTVVNHTPSCSCEQGYTGDPFTGCQPIQAVTPSPKPKPRDPCYPSPCGTNAKCRPLDSGSVCECFENYSGNPYTACRPECVTNSECTRNTACIQNRCKDPCPGVCGHNAECNVINHTPTCTCPEGMVGNAFEQCIRKQSAPPHDPCYPSPCGQNTICRLSGENAVCECLPDFKGTPFGRGCYPECVINSDCPRDKTCVNKKCVDPCPGVCGYRAICHAINNNPVCSCPSNMIGDPFVECKEAPPTDPCNPSPCRTNGICRVIGGRAECLYPECVTNSDCSSNRACFNQKCRDPCVGACGLNAVCNVVNHAPICSCPERHVGSPFVQCNRQVDNVPSPECINDDQCTNDKACINQQCVNPCAANSDLCNLNAECRVQFHRAICTCREGYTGNAQFACNEIGCRADSDCPATEACINKNCIDPCQYTQCGRNAVCRTDYNHNARCHCLDGYRGNAITGCVRPECIRDDECPYHLSCQNEQCRDPCNCAPRAQCRVDNHQALCRCPPGYTGDASFACEKIIIHDPDQCKLDADCPSKLACFSGLCKNPCQEAKPCAQYATCTVQDTLPLRTMFCVCDDGYIGDAEKQCSPVSPGLPGCGSDVECAATEICKNRVCVNPCTEFNPCSRTAECLAQSHKAICSCPIGMVGDPFQNCYHEPVSAPECTIDSECASNRACVNQKCQDPCADGNPCAANAECRTQYHRPLCTCSQGWGGNPKIHCYKPECQIDNDCPYDKACFNEKCLNPCTYGATQCGRGAECQPQGHRANCICPPGTQGNPLISCVTGLCQYNEDCADHEACDRLNRVCRPVCDDEACAATANCIGKNHQATCECISGTRGNPYVGCAQDEPEPECQFDGDCPSQQACLNSHCANPCSAINPCSRQQSCTVEDTLPLRTMICACPSDMLVDVNGYCTPIVIEGCKSDNDCSDIDRCIRGQCVVACRAEPCGVNAQCVSGGHRAQCTCPPEFIGNPHIECIPEAKTNTPKECTIDDDCPLDRSCSNERCVNPCMQEVCGRGAICNVQLHTAICNCPIGYTKDQTGNCVPPAADLPKCQSNSDCTTSETCVNEICTNPCNCGQNADCFVKSHYPVCSCKPGFSGNAQYGCVKLECQSDSECPNDKQCYNGECLNPCALDDSCALNAECYGDKHRAACRCLPGLEGNPLVQCRRVECHFDGECSSNRACLHERCIDPCSEMAPCAQNAICFTRNHAPYCKCPEHLPDGNPFSFCERRLPIPECTMDVNCPSRQACINNKCLDPCTELTPCTKTAKCTVLDSTPVRTMVCECPELHVPDLNGECRRKFIQPIGECTSDSECSEKEACINRQCRNPCNCGAHATCSIKNHRGVCSCEDGYEGNPNIGCRTIGCRVDSECESSKACINRNCVNPCLDNNPCGINAECFTVSNRAECRCLSGYRGNHFIQCTVVECRSNNDCPNDKQCRNSQCVDPCIYDSTCSPRAECKAQNHLAVCRCPSGLVGNPYVDCRLEVTPECVYDTDCPSHLACIENKCIEPCGILQPCSLPARCEVIPSTPVRTMICVCPDGYISSGSGTCKPIVKSGCISDSDCSSDTACVNSICRNPCNCGPSAECRIKDHKPVCSCKQGYDGNPEIECIKIECRADDDCSSQHSCINRQCVPVCSIDSCGKQSECYAQNHRAICECLPGYEGDPRVSCKLLGCRADTDCPLDKACINRKCENPCENQAICAQNELCQVYQHRAECACPPPFEPDPIKGCVLQDDRCRTDGECPSQTACIQGECVNPCNVTEPCGVNSMCKVLDTLPVRTMICECLPGYQGNAAIQCDKMALCQTNRGFIRDANGECVCPPGYGLTSYDDCQICPIKDGVKIDEAGRCVCALERGMVIDERGRCICPIDHGYRLTEQGECVRTAVPECIRNNDCPDWRYCEEQTKTCEDPCQTKVCGKNALCNTTNHQAVCQCIAGYTGNPEEYCNQTTNFRTDFPQPEMQVTCQADGVQVVIDLMESNFNGVLYVKGHSKDEECRRVVNLAGDSSQRTQVFKVHFGSCGLIHINGIASFVLVIQKHPKLVTYKAQAYHIKCVYQTGEQNVTLGFNVQMLTTAGTIANTGPPPTCAMRIVAFNGEEINSAEIGDNLRLQVEVQPATIYGGFARSCVAKTMEDSIENEYIVTDENGCATEPSIFGDWEYNPETNSLLASFNAFKFPSSDNIRFQCNIRVCFGRCQPVNCHGANAFGKRRRRAITDMNEIELILNRTRRASSTALAADDSLGIEGTLREEITVESNAILTLERRDERSYDNDNITPAAQRVEDICVSMIGLIIALVITALLALVAVAVAVSCWLMAYRRRPTITGPLPHPPEFPNPLFAHQEPSEPSHNYMT